MKFQRGTTLAAYAILSLTGAASFTLPAELPAAHAPVVIGSGHDRLAPRPASTTSFTDQPTLGTRSESAATTSTATSVR